MERLQKLEGVNILKGRVGAEWVEWGHMAAENIGEHWRMLGKKFYITAVNSTVASVVHTFQHSILEEDYPPWWNLLELDKSPECLLHHLLQ